MFRFGVKAISSSLEGSRSQVFFAKAPDTMEIPSRAGYLILYWYPANGCRSQKAGSPLLKQKLVQRLTDSLSRYTVPHSKSS